MCEGIVTLAEICGICIILVYSLLQRVPSKTYLSSCFSIDNAKISLAIDLCCVEIARLALVRYLESNLLVSSAFCVCKFPATHMRAFHKNYR